jgi:hypothetical protein
MARREKGADVKIKATASTLYDGALAPLQGANSQRVPTGAAAYNAGLAILQKSPDGNELCKAIHWYPV